MNGFRRKGEDARSERGTEENEGCDTNDEVREGFYLPILVRS